MYLAEDWRYQYIYFPNSWGKKGYSIVRNVAQYIQCSDTGSKSFRAPSVK